MKKCFFYLLCSILFCCPCLVFAQISCSNGEYKATIDLDKSDIGMNDKAVITVSSDYEYKIDYEVGTKNVIRINNVGVVSPVGVGSTKVNVVISFIKEEVEVSKCTSSLTINVLNHDSSLKSLNLEEIDISSDFSSDLFDYVVTLPYNYEKINIVAEANDKNAKITGDGRRYLEEGDNEFEILVKATDGSFSTYTITVLREKANDDKSLKNLIVEGYVLTPKFNKDVYEYSLSVDKNVEDITINATPSYEFAQVEGNGSYKLASGDNTFKITVIAEDKSEQEYTLLVNKSMGNSKLNSLEVKGYNLDKKFSSDEYIYKITVNSDVEKLEINATSEDNDKIEIIGNDKLVVGENNIIIRVSNEDKGATTYKIIVNKLSEEEQEIVEKNDNLLKILFVVFIISIVIMVTLIVIFVIRNRNKDNKVKRINNK